MIYIFDPFLIELVRFGAEDVVLFKRQVPICINNCSRYRLSRKCLMKHTIHIYVCMIYSGAMDTRYEHD